MLDRTNIIATSYTAIALWLAPAEMSGARRPATTARARTAQTRSIARAVSGWCIPGTWQGELRLLTQPVFRIENSTGDRDGSLFLWCEDWDPELMALVETRS